MPPTPLQAILLLVPAFLLIGWGHTLPVLGLGLLLYSFGEQVCQGWGAAGPPVAGSPLVPAPSHAPSGRAPH